MKKSFILALTVCAMLGQTISLQAKPKDAEHRKAEIATMIKDKATRLMIIHQLMASPEGKKELAEMLKSDASFRSYYESHTTNPG